MYLLISFMDYRHTGWYGRCFWLGKDWFWPNMETLMFYCFLTLTSGNVTSLNEILTLIIGLVRMSNLCYKERGREKGKSERNPFVWPYGDYDNLCIKCYVGSCGKWGQVRVLFYQIRKRKNVQYLLFCFKNLCNIKYTWMPYPL